MIRNYPGAIIITHIGQPESSANGNIYFPLYFPLTLENSEKKLTILLQLAGVH